MEETKAIREEVVICWYIGSKSLMPCFWRRQVPENK